LQLNREQVRRAQLSNQQGTNGGANCRKNPPTTHMPAMGAARPPRHFGGQQRIDGNHATSGLASTYPGQHVELRAAQTNEKQRE
jgi:hypothetical protein